MPMLYRVRAMRGEHFCTSLEMWKLERVLYCGPDEETAQEVLAESCKEDYPQHRLPSEVGMSARRTVMDVMEGTYAE